MPRVFMETPNNKFILGTISSPIFTKKENNLGTLLKYSLDKDTPNPAMMIKKANMPLIALGIKV